MIFMIIIVSSTYGEILAFTGAASGMTSYITSLAVPPIAIIIGMLIVVLILGCFHGNGCHYDDYHTYLYGRCEYLWA